MIQLRQLVPTNFAEEKTKFLADTAYNPQFSYEEPILAADLTYYGKPEKKLLQLARFIVKAHAPLYMLRVAMKNREEILSDELVRAQTTTYLDSLSITQRYAIHFKAVTAARCSITTNTITFRSNSDYTENTLEATLNHELGTHALRRINDESQPWHGKKNKLGFSNALVTEEGLAILHQQLDQRIPTLYNSAVIYLANEYAQTHSFAELWQWLALYIHGDEKRWTICFRAKRGLTDTSIGGSYSKDLVYLQGAYEVSQWLAENDFDLSKLYWGKISHRDVALAEEAEAHKNIILPPFFTQDPVKYADKITRIREINSFV